jgi:hypothetical protein
MATTFFAVLLVMGGGIVAEVVRSADAGFQQRHDIIGWARGGLVDGDEPVVSIKRVADPNTAVEIVCVFVTGRIIGELAKLCCA